MSVPTDAVFEIPEEGDNDGARPHEGGENQAHVDENNVPHPTNEGGENQAHADENNVPHPTNEGATDDPSI